MSLALVMLCCSVLSLKKFDKKSFIELHPGGKIGKKLKTLGEIMDTDLPIINSQSSIIDAVLIMTEKNMVALWFDQNKKIRGIITDGDLRRSISKVNVNEKATMIMKSRPIVATSDLLISSAIVLMNKHSITSLIIASQTSRSE